MRIYLDSNVFILFINSEVDKSFRGLFIKARDFFENVKEQKHFLVLSKLFFREVNKIIYLDKTAVLSELFGCKIKVVNTTKNDLILSNKLNAHYPDSLHAAIAINNGCDCIVTFNIKDFSQISGSLNVLLPSDL